MKSMTRYFGLFLLLSAALVLAACSSGGSSYSRVSYGRGMGYGGGYYGGSPYGYHRPPGFVVDTDHPVAMPLDTDHPVAMPLDGPGMDFGMPEAGFDDFGGSDDFGGFD